MNTFQVFRIKHRKIIVKSINCISQKRLFYFVHTKSFIKREQKNIDFIGVFFWIFWGTGWGEGGIGAASITSSSDDT